MPWKNRKKSKNNFCYNKIPIAFNIDSPGQKDRKLVTISFSTQMGKNSILILDKKTNRQKISIKDKIFTNVEMNRKILPSSILRNLRNAELL